MTPSSASLCPPIPVVLDSGAIANVHSVHTGSMRTFLVTHPALSLLNALEDLYGEERSAPGDKETAIGFTKKSGISVVAVTVV